MCDSHYRRSQRQSGWRYTLHSSSPRRSRVASRSTHPQTQTQRQRMQWKNSILIYDHRVTAFMGHGDRHGGHCIAQCLGSQWRASDDMMTLCQRARLLVRICYGIVRYGLYGYIVILQRATVMPGTYMNSMFYHIMFSYDSDCARCMRVFVQPGRRRVCSRHIN